MHIVFGEGAAARLSSALVRLGNHDDKVIVFPSDLSLGPIDPPDAFARQQWSVTKLGGIDIGDHLEVERFWTSIQSESYHFVIWVSRRVPREFAGFLELVCRLGDAPFEIMDLTDVMVTTRSKSGARPLRRLAGSLSSLSADQIIEEDLLRRTSAFPPDRRASCSKQWQALRKEDAPLRLVDSNLALVSVPISFFDEQLFSYVQRDWLKAARIVGDVLSSFWKTKIYPPNDEFLAWRLWTLVEEGMIEGRGNLFYPGASEVRLSVRKRWHLHA